MKSCKLYIVRHGESEHNRDNITSGHVDPRLTRKGREQAAATRDALLNITFDEVYSSDLRRAADTAEIIFGAPVLESHRLPALRERNYGAMDGKPVEHWEDIKRSNARATANLSADAAWQFKHTPDAESDYELSERFAEALVQIAQANPSKNVLVAAHGGTLRTMLIKLGYATSITLPSKSVDNAAYVELDFLDGTFNVKRASGINLQV